VTGFLTAEGVTKRYGAVTALRGVDLSFARGSFVLLLGPNGAGKSTLLGILAGRIRPTAGKVTLAGRELRGDEEARSRTGLVAHAPFLYPGLTARENLLLFARLYKVASPAARVEETLALVGMADRADERVGGFSRGMTQRTSIARSLLHDPDLLIWDEPFSGLDLQIAASLRLLLVSLKEKGRTILLATHELGPAAGLPDEVVVVAKGRVRHRGRPEGDLTALYLSVMDGLRAGGRA
jgi:ABC-type multidrug transport system ATPase subunit